MSEALPDAVQRLADAYLQPHHVETVRQLMRLCERARLQQRVTMSYDPTRVGSGGTRSHQGELADSAAGARQLLNRLAGQVAGDCWGVLLDVCAFDKGLQQIELERGWPRRSAKLVLRIGLEQLATQWGLQPVAEGREKGHVLTWLPERPAMFANEA